VVATDPETGQTADQKITWLHINYDHEFTDLTVIADDTTDGKTESSPAVIHTTQEHPFWSETQHTWVPAGVFAPGLGNSRTL